MNVAERTTRIQWSQRFRARLIRRRYQLRTWTRKQLERVPLIFDSLDSKTAVIITIVATLMVPYLPWKLPNILSLTSYSAVWILAGFIGISVTLLALLYAILTFRGQQLAARLPSDLVGDLFEPRWHRAAFWRLLAIFVVSVAVLGPVDEVSLPASVANALTASFVLLLLVVTSIQRGIGRVFDKHYPQAVAYRILQRVTDTYLLNQRSPFFSASLASGVTTEVADPFSLIEQVCIRAIKEGDLTTAHVVLRAVTGRVLDFTGRETRSARAALGWLGELFSVIGRKALEYDERTAELLMVLFQEVLQITLERQLPWPNRIELLASFRELRHAAIRQKKTAAVESGLHALGNVFQSALEKAPAEDHFWSLHPQEPPPPAHDTDAELEWHHISDDLLWPLKRDMELIIAEDLPDEFGTGLFVHRQMGYDVLESKHLGALQKRFLLQHILWQSKSAVLEALSNGRGAAYVGWSFDFLEHTLDKAGLSELIMAALSHWSELVIEAARAARLPWITLNQFAAAGRGFAREGRDEQGILVAETLGTIAEPLALHTDGEMRSRYLEAASALGSLIEWDKRADSELKRIVQSELAKYTERDARLKDWKESTPARRRIPPGGAHATPWA